MYNTGAHFILMDSGPQPRQYSELLGLSVAVVLAVVAGRRPATPRHAELLVRHPPLYSQCRYGGQRDLGGAPVAEGGGTHPGAYFSKEAAALPHRRSFA